VTCAAVGGSAALSSGMMSTIARTVSAPSVAASLSSLAVGDHLHATQSVMSTMQQLAVAQQLHHQQQQQQQQVRINYTVSGIKWNHSVFAPNFVKYWPIFKIVSHQKQP